jgi:hypothetical protein
MVVGALIAMHRLASIDVPDISAYFDANAQELTTTAPDAESWRLL